VLAASTALAAACGGSDNTSTVTAPTGTVSTETFTGTLNPPVGGVFQANIHSFTVTTAGGSINVTLVSAGPPPTIQLGLALGNPSSTGTCSIIPGFSQQTSAGSTAQISGAGAPAGAYCVAVGDVGNVLQPVSYTITVAHT
jgi:hypothetical protein